MRERASPWFRTPVVTHAPLPWMPLSHRYEFAELGGACGEADGEIPIPGIPSCPKCAMAIEYAIRAEVGAYDDHGRFSLFARAFPKVAPEHNQALRMWTPAGLVDIVASETYAPHSAIIEVLDFDGEVVKRLSVGVPGLTMSRLNEEIISEMNLGNRVETVVLSPRTWAQLNSDTAELRRHDVSPIERW